MRFAEYAAQAYMDPADELRASSSLWANSVSELLILSLSAHTFPKNVISYLNCPLRLIGFYF